MTDQREDLDKVIDDLKQQRDELRLKMHLAKAEAKQEWEELETKWQEIESRLPSLKKAAAQSAGDVGAALGLVAEEITKAYKRLRDSLD
jgi:SMC interacting uncharacterized protein involved in chromosome segregation